MPNIEYFFKPQGPTSQPTTAPVSNLHSPVSYSVFNAPTPQAMSADKRMPSNNAMQYLAPLPVDNYFSSFLATVDGEANEANRI
jgi:hypothetical protein